MREIDINNDEQVRKAAEKFFGCNFLGELEDPIEKPDAVGDQNQLCGERKVVVGGKRFKARDLGAKNGGLQAADCIHSKFITEDPKVRNKSRNRS